MTHPLGIAEETNHEAVEECVFGRQLQDRGWRPRYGSASASRVGRGDAFWAPMRVDKLSLVWLVPHDHIHDPHEPPFFCPLWTQTSSSSLTSFRTPSLTSVSSVVCPPRVPEFDAFVDCRRRAGHAPAGCGTYQTLIAGGMREY